MFRNKKKQKECKDLQLEQLELENQLSEEVVEERTGPRKISWPKVKTITCFALAFALLISSTIAYFADNVTIQTQGTAGSVDIVFDSNVNLLNADGKDILNPGDIRDVNFSVQNNGNKSADVKTVITLLSSVPMHNNYYDGTGVSSVFSLGTGNPNENLYGKYVYNSEYELYDKSDLVFVEGYGHYPIDGTTVLRYRTIDSTKKKIVYRFDNTVLSGNNDLGECESEWASIISSQYHVFSEIGTKNENIEFYYDDFSEYNNSLGVICVAYPYLADKIDKTLVIPDSLYADSDNYEQMVRTANYICINDILGCVDSISVSKNIEGFLYWSNDGYMLYCKEEVEDLFGISVSCYNDYDVFINTKNLISDSEYSQLSDERKSDYVKCSDSKTFDLALLFDPNSANDFQNSNVTIKIEVWAKQHRNAEDFDWIKIDEELYSSIKDSLFTVDYNGLHEASLTGVKDTDTFLATKNVVIPEGVEVIPSHFFQSCDWIETVSLPSTLKRIEAGAFEDCTNLQSINIPDGIEEIPYNCFRNCSSLTGIVFPNTLKTIGSQAFSNCTSITSINIPDSVTCIDASFINTGLTTVSVPDSVTNLGYMAFANCANLESAVLPAGITRINNLFENCTNFTSVTIRGQRANYLPRTITRVEAMSFAKTAITEIDIDITGYIENNSFYNCHSLSTIKIGDAVTGIGGTAFRCDTTVNTNVYTNNSDGLNYNWSRYNRPVTIYPYG